jgi:hypothetical protein
LLLLVAENKLLFDRLKLFNVLVQVQLYVAVLQFDVLYQLGVVDEVELLAVQLFLLLQVDFLVLKIRRFLVHHLEFSFRFVLRFNKRRL